MSLLSKTFFAAAVLIISTFSHAGQAAERSVVRIFESSRISSSSYSSNREATCYGVGCRFIEVEILENSILSVKSCTSEVALLQPDPPGARTAGVMRSITENDVIPAKCTSLIESLRLTDEIRERTETQLQRRNRHLGRLALSSITTGYFGITAIGLGLIAVLPPRDIPELAGILSLASGGFAALASRRFKHEVLGEAMIVNPKLSEIKKSDIQKALAENKVNAFFLATFGSLQISLSPYGENGNKGANSETLRKEYNRYLQAWENFADNLSLECGDPLK